MRRLIYSLIIFILIGGIILTAYAPDEISTVFIVLMEAIVFLGVVFGIFPVIRFYLGFEKGLESIERALEVQTSSTWSAMEQIEDFFNQRILDGLFQEYQDKVKGQRESGQVLADIEDYFNDDILGRRSWQSVITQIPGTLTGLGILGTFIGLIIGIQGIGFSSVNAALSSVNTMLSGIQVAFYTSIAGVILSLVFNIIYRIAWNAMMHNLGVFVDAFHKNVIPPVEEQMRYRERKEVKQITDLLERLPKGNAYSVSNGGAAVTGQSNGNEQILMPQILQGLKDGEFVFYLQPRYDLNTRNITGAEALVRWNHGKLGMVSPAVFIPVLESNGYITKLDQYIWEQVCVTIRHWIDGGIRPVPITINVTKTDIMAMDIVEFFDGMLKKYRIPPRQLEIDIAENAYMQAGQTAIDTETKLRQSGFKVAIDGFDGNFIALSTIDGLQADILKLDLRHFAGNSNQGALNSLFDQARKLQFTVAVEGIESMEQLSMLRKCGCSEGQGFYLSKPISVEDFENKLNSDKNTDQGVTARAHARINQAAELNANKSNAAQAKPEAQAETTPAAPAVRVEAAVAPAEPEAPDKPEAPIEPEAPVKSGRSVKAGRSVKSADPVEPEAPVKPVVPAEPETPVKSARSVKAGRSVKSAGSVKSSAPVEPVLIPTETTIPARQEETPTAVSAGYTADKKDKTVKNARPAFFTRVLERTEPDFLDSGFVESSDFRDEGKKTKKDKKDKKDGKKKDDKEKDEDKKKDKKDKKVPK